MIRKLASFVGGNGRKVNSFRKESFSQCGEDLIVDHIFQAIGIAKPSYIDIGAHHPMHINNTFFFYSKGSRGINVEPDPALFSAFIEFRPDDTNLNVGVGLQKGTSEFYVMSEPSLNSFSKDEVDRALKENSTYAIKKVLQLNLVTVTDVIRDYNSGTYPDFMSIDIEGLDEQILRSLNYQSDAPKVLCVETLTFSTKGKGEKKTDLIEFLKAQGYMVYADTYINTIFVRSDVWAGQ